MKTEFHCQPGCTLCCQGNGRVYLVYGDVERAANALGISNEQFINEHTYSIGGTMFLKNPCPFLTDKGCGIHAGKPWQCYSFPYWPGSLKSQETWNALCERCPGIVKG